MAAMQEHYRTPSGSEGIKDSIKKECVFSLELRDPLATARGSVTEVW